MDGARTDLRDSKLQGDNDTAPRCCDRFRSEPFNTHPDRCFWFLPCESAAENLQRLAYDKNTLREIQAVAFCLSGGKRTLALRGRNQPGILSPKRRSDVRGQRVSVTLLPNTLACFLQPLVTIENRLKVFALRSGSTKDRNSPPTCTHHHSSPTLRCEPMPEENPGARGRAPLTTASVIV